MTIRITKDAKDLIVGGLLGDAGCHFHPHGYKSPYLKFTHTEKDFNYLLWKQELMLPTGLIGQPIRFYQHILNYKGEHRLYLECYFETRSNQALIEFRNLFYPNGEKIVSQEILNQVTPQALAIWYMDDGSLYRQSQNKSGVNYALHLGTFAYGEDGNKLIQKFLLDTYDIESKLSHRADGVCLMIYKLKEVVKFCDLVQPYIHPSMKRKII